MLSLLLLTLVSSPPPTPAAVRPEPPRPPDAPPTIVVTGVGRVTAAPDKVEVFVTVQNGVLNVDESMNMVNAGLKEVWAAVRGVGVEGPDVRLSTVSVNFQGDTTRPYKVRKELVIALRAPSKLDSLLVELGKIPYVAVSRVELASEALIATPEDLLSKAVENARSRAEKLAAPVGASVGRALRIRAMDPEPMNRSTNGVLSSQSLVEVEFELVGKR